VFEILNNVELPLLSRVLQDKLVVAQLITEFLAFYGKRRLITALTGTHHQSLSSARSFQAITITLFHEDSF
jgi:hypothetical protein